MESSQDLEAPPLPPRHPVFLNNSPHSHPTAPEVPWTPPRHSLNVKPRRETSLLEGFRSPRTSALLEPLISLKTKEHPTKMADLDLVNRECEKRLRTFKSLLRRHDPSGTDPGVVVEFYQTWGQELSIALSSLEESVSNMIIDHKAAMSTDAINQWETCPNTLHTLWP